MKASKNITIPFFLIVFLFPILGIGQTDCNPILKKVEQKIKTGNLEKALKLLQEAEICDYKNVLTTERQQLQDNIFKAIIQQRKTAETNLQKAKEAKKEVEKAKQEAQDALAKLKTENTIRTKIFNEAIEKWKEDNKDNYTIKGDNWKTFIDGISFYDKPLSSLPIELFTLRNLETLSITNCPLRKIDIEISSLTKLKTLNLSDNKLDNDLPESIGQLKSLTKLYLENNDLKKLPLSIGNLDSLLYLDLRDNQNLDLASVFSAFSNYNRKIKISAGAFDFSKNYEDVLQISISPPSNLPHEIGQIKTLFYLDLSDSFIKKLPETFGNIDSLKYLDLSGNAFEIELPKSIGKLKELVQLDLSENSTELKLPEEIGKLKKLKKLNLKNSKILKIPKSIGNLKNLITLDLTDNKDLDLNSLFIGLSEHPKTIQINYHYSIDNDIERGQLSILLNNLTHLPEAIGNVKNLVILNLSRNKIKKIPLSIGNLKRLKYLNLTSNDSLKILPNTIGNLDSLMELRLNQTKITHLPSSIKNLAMLKSFYIQNKGLDLKSLFIALEDSPQNVNIHSITRNPWDSFNGKSNDLDVFVNKFSELPSEIGDIKNLVHLDLRECNLKDIPKTLGKLSNLKSFQLTSNPDLNFISLSNAISKTKKKVHISSNRNPSYLFANSFRDKKNIPDGFLFISTDALSEIPDEMGTIENLTHLDLGGNDLEKIPSSLGNLKNLEKLNLSSNAFKEIPKSFGNLRKLEILDLRYNKNLDPNTLSDAFKDYPKAIKFNPEYPVYNEDVLKIEFDGEIPRIEKVLTINQDCRDCQNPLKEIPNSILKIKELRSLSLSGNKIKKIPRSIKNLKQLEYLDLSNNHIKKVSKQIGKLKNLTILDLKGNKNLDLPSLIKILSKHKKDIEISIREDSYPTDNRYLLVRIDPLRNVPKEFGKLHNLSLLDLGYETSNRSSIHGFVDRNENEEAPILNFQSLIDAFAPLEKDILITNVNNLDSPDDYLIKDHYFIKNSLLKIIIGTTSPISHSLDFGKLKNLVYLDLSSKNMMFIPSSIGALKRLRYLDLERNQISSIPEKLFELSNLKWLELSINKLNSISPNIENLDSLNFLNLSYNKIEKITDEIGNLTNLTTLGFHFQDQKLVIPKSFIGLKKLKILNLDGNDINEIPIELSKLNNLQQLSLEENRILNQNALIQTFKDHHKKIDICVNLDSDRYFPCFSQNQSQNLIILLNKFEVDNSTIHLMKNLSSLTFHNCYISIDSLKEKIPWCKISCFQN